MTKLLAGRVFVFMIVMSMLLFATIYIERNSFYANKTATRNVRFYSDGEKNNVQREKRWLALMLRQLRDGIDKNNDLMRHHGMPIRQDTRDEQVEDTGNIVTGNRVSDVAVVASDTDYETIGNPPVHENAHLVDDIPYMIDPFYQPSVSALLSSTSITPLNHKITSGNTV